MKKIKIFSLFVCLAMLVIACHNDDDERGVQMRTVLVYIAGDNSLRSFATEDLAEMTEGMQSVDDNSYNLLVYIDTGSSGTGWNSTGIATAIRMYYTGIGLLTMAGK